MAFSTIITGEMHLRRTQGAGVVFRIKIWLWLFVNIIYSDPKFSTLCDPCAVHKKIDHLIHLHLMRHLFSQDNPLKCVHIQQSY